ncbi:MAG: hypothetical protein ACXIVF_07795 [Rhizobiaceae bacterium]
MRILSGYSLLAPMALAALLLAAPMAHAQGLEADGARDTIIGSDVQTGEVSVDEDRERIVEAIANTGDSIQEVRRRFNLGEVSIVLLSDINTTEGPVAEAVETNIEAIEELRIAIESSAMFFHAIDSRRVLLQNVLGMEFDDDDVIIFAIGGGEVQ